MIEDDDVMAEDFIPDEDNAAETEVDIYELLFSELNEIISNQTSSQADSLTSWLIGERLRKTLAVITEADKAKKAFEELQKKIANKFGSDFTSERLYECLKIADEFPDLALFSDIAEHLTLKHLQLILKLESDLERTFYCEMVRQKSWTVKTLKESIEANTFQKEFGDNQ